MIEEAGVSVSQRRSAASISADPGLQRAQVTRDSGVVTALTGSRIAEGWCPGRLGTGSRRSRIGMPAVGLSVTTRRGPVETLEASQRPGGRHRAGYAGRGRQTEQKRKGACQVRADRANTSSLSTLSVAPASDVG